MDVRQVILALICVAAISGGQILFKRAGLEIQVSGTWFSHRAFVFIGLASLIYGTASLLWIQLLRTTPLVQAYPFMALSFILVPMMGRLWFGEVMQYGQWVGTGLVVMGLLMMTLSSRS